MSEDHVIGHHLDAGPGAPGVLGVPTGHGPVHLSGPAPSGAELEKGPFRRQLDLYLGAYDAAVQQLFEAEESWRTSAELMQQVADDLTRETTNVGEALGGASEVARSAGEAFAGSAEELVVKAERLRTVSRHFRVVRSELQRAQQQAATMDGRAAAAPAPEEDPMLARADAKDPVVQQRMRARQQQATAHTQTQEQNEVDAERLVRDLDQAYREASAALRSLHEVPVQEEARRTPAETEDPTLRGEAVPGQGAAGGHGAAAAAGAGAFGGGGGIGAGAFGAAAVGGLVGLRSMRTMSRALPGSGGTIGGTPQGGAGAAAAAGGPGGRYAGGMPVGAGGAGGAGAGSRGSRSPMWDDGEDWVDDEAAGPDVMR